MKLGCTFRCGRWWWAWQLPVAGGVCFFALLQVQTLAGCFTFVRRWAGLGATGEGYARDHSSDLELGGVGAPMVALGTTHVAIEAGKDGQGRQGRFQAAICQLADMSLPA